ncbi:MAG: AAA family ATPase [Muribaculaceae bacterium]|nr:AAA family ATPase [Muribaculaceae bacterium]
MYLEKIIFDNRAPFEHLEIDFKNNGVNVITAINGKGKTTILSHIADAFYELARPAYPQEFEGKENKLYRVSSPLYNMTSSKPSIVYFRFKDDEDIYDYIDVRDICTKEQYDAAIDVDNKIDYNDFQRRLKQQNFSKYWNVQNNDIRKKMFEQNVLTYFPSYRFELPAYLNDSYSNPLKYSIDSKFSGYLPNQIEVISDITSFSNWLLDVLLDLKNGERIQLFKDGKNNVFPITIPAQENIVLTNLNNILSNTLSSKKYQGSVRFGIGKRNGGMARIAIMNDVDNEHHYQICPSIFQLSSGELALISIFGEIIHQADNNVNNTPLENIKGIVLIDEIEEHLHITLQKEILPKMFALFPNVQFIVSSHSPFLNMGLATELSGKHRIFDLDHNGISCSATKNDLYEEVYNLMIDENNRFAKLCEDLTVKLESLTKPLVITEGKTDIKHILKAKEKLGVTDLDFDIIQEDQQPDGDSNLYKLLEQAAHIENKNIIIGIFDRDIKKTVENIEKNGQQIKDFGNNVYAFCIPLPESRRINGEEDISIEFLYSDEEIHSTLNNGCSLFFGDEFSPRTGRHNIDKTLTLSKQSDRGKHKIVENNGGQAVYNEQEENILAKKDDFANAILSDEIEISEESWNNFKPIFETIRSILQKD